ncbi:MAG: NAD(P)H-dependent oxidoreductase [Acidimicrobiia bacterium]|nr:NAD(P)H-dependent oxidoreductase [Acidimicrobiia bacterium]
MPTLVIHAHPLEDSYSAALRDAVCEALAATGAACELVRLCQGEETDEATLAASDHLVVVYPTWWGGLPAVLLDWVQRTVGPWVDGESADTPSPLAAVRRVTVVTSHGSSRLLNTMQGQPGKQTWSRVVMPLCAKDARFDWMSLYKIDRSDESGRQAFIERVRARLTSVAAPV